MYCFLCYLYYVEISCAAWKKLLAFLFLLTYCVEAFSTNKDIPKIKKFFFQENVVVSEMVSVTCITSSKSPVSYTWTKDGQPMEEEGERRRFSSTEDVSVLILDPVQLTDNGNYTCTAVNAFGKDQHTAQLNVRAPPRWERLPLDVITTLGETVEVECAASSSPPSLIKFVKISGSRSVPEDWKDGRGMMRWRAVSHDQSGTYQCEADNGIFPPITANFTIIIRVPAKFEEKFSVVNVKKGDSGRMKCQALGDQPLSITWQRDDATITKTGDDQRYEIFETIVPKGVVSELIIRTSDKDDGALYTCIAENEFGNDHRKIRLLVLEVPAPPLDVKIREIWSRSASVSWAPPYSGNSPITKFIVLYWRDVGGSPQEISVPSSQSSALMKNLHPGTSYLLKVVAENAVGRGEPSDAASFTTGEEEPSSPPSDIIAEPRGSSTIRVSWKPPPIDSLNGDLRSYYVGYKVRDSNQPYSYKSVEYVPDVTQEFFLTNLLKASDYSIVVKAYNSAGSGPPSHEMYVRTLDGDLPPAPSLYVLSTSASSVSLRWNTRKMDNPLSGYTVHYREDQDGDWQEVAVVAPEDNTYTLSNLHPHKLYQIYVTATNQYGKGDPSEIVVIRTDEGGHSLLSVAGGVGSSMDVAIVIPVAASLLTIGVVLFVACLCVKKIRSRQNLERALAAEKHLAMVGTLQRYVDIDKTRSLMDPNRIGAQHYPLPYETIQMMAKGGTLQRPPFIHKDGTQTIYNKSTLRRKEEDEDHIYDSAQ